MNTLKINKPNSKEEVIEYLMNQFPDLQIQEKFTGHVLNIEDSIVYTRLYTEKEIEYECEFDKQLFPQKDLSENISFFLVLGSINGKTFSHINYFYWTQDQLDEAKARAEELSKWLLIEN